MASLAQSIIDTAHNMAAKPRKTQARYTETYFNSTAKFFNNAARAAHMAELSTEFYKDIPAIAPLVKKAMRFSIDQNVADAIVKIAKTPDETLLQALPYARPPHNPAWIEFCLPEGDLKVGWLVESKGNDLHMHYVFSTSKMNHFPTYMPETGSYGIVSPDGYRAGLNNRTTASYNQDMAKERHQHIRRTCHDALSILLLLNSRSKILTVEEPSDNLTKLNKARLKNGKEEIMPMNKVVFDIARVIRKTGKSDVDAMREMAAALVRGHFKVRQTGVFFWSPHVRNARDEDDKKEIYTREIASERRDVVCTGPTMLPQPL